MPISFGGQTYSDEDVRKFYQGGGDDNQFLQQHGVSDLGQIHDLAVQGRGIAGDANPTGDAALQQQFQRYRASTPNGSMVNDYNGYVNGLGAGTANSVRSGTYTGAAIAPQDYTPGGIFGPGSASYGQPGYASGLGAQGNGGGFSAAGGNSQPAPSNLGMGGRQPIAGGNPPMGGGMQGQGGPMPGGQQGYGQNPYLSGMADDIARRSDRNLGMGLQSIRSNAVAGNTLGGSRQGVAEGLAIGNANDTLQGNLSNLYGTDYNNSQNRNLQAYGIDQNNATSRFGISTGANTAATGQMQNFYTQQRQLDQSGVALGAGIYAQGNAGYLNQGAGIGAIGTQQQQAPWNVVNSANSAIGPYAGVGSTNASTGSSYQPGSMGQAAGGALAGYQLGKNLGLGGGGNSGSNWSTQGGQYNNPSAYGSSQPYMADNNIYNPTY